MSLDTFTGPIPMTAAVPTSIRVVGLDLSLTGTGVAIFDEGGIRTGLITSKGKKVDTLAQRAARLTTLFEQITNLIPERALVVIEAPTPGSNGHQHDRSGLWWMVVSYLRPFNVVVEIAPGTVKKFATGNGAAGKDAMLAAAIRRYPSAEVNDNNVADAVHLMAMGARHLGHPQEADTAKIAEAMAVPRWSL
jgi:crossover junction endodeoxyribonuclease RuvC